MSSVITKWYKFDVWIIKKDKCYYKVGQLWYIYCKEGQPLLQSGTGLMHALKRSANLIAKWASLVHPLEIRASVITFVANWDRFGACIIEKVKCYYKVL